MNGTEKTLGYVRVLRKSPIKNHRGITKIFLSHQEIFPGLGKTTESRAKHFAYSVLILPGLSRWFG